MSTTFPPPVFASLPAGAAPGSHTVDQPGWNGMRQATFTEWANRVGGAFNLGGYQDIYGNRWLCSRTGACVFVFALAYNFSAAQGVSSPNHANYRVSVAGGSMSAGVSATLTLTPVPWGLNAADVAHSIHITDGGNSEDVVITGGTAIAGSASGTVTVTPSHNHTGGSWTVGSATSGVYEAKNDLPSDLTKLEGAFLLGSGAAPQYFHSGAWQVLSITIGIPTDQDLSSLCNGSTVTFTLSGNATRLHVYLRGTRRRQGGGLDYTFTGGTSQFTLAAAPATGDELIVTWWA